MKLLGAYKNGNYATMIFDDGTKVRKTDDNVFIPDHAENMDIKITNYCDMGCPFCHEGSTLNGCHADILNQKFIDTLHEYQEVAIGGGDATSHPDLIPFLRKLKDKKVITNMTVNQKHFDQKQELIKYLVDEKLIYGLGVSLVNPTTEFIKMAKRYPNAVIHVINGILTEDDVAMLQNNNLKMLILGYKELRRGNEYLTKKYATVKYNQLWLYNNLDVLFTKFNTVSFDNLAIEQLEVKRLMSESEWEQFYMGDDGSSTFYIDMVNHQFARSSTAPMNKRYDLLTSVDNMFKIILTENAGEKSES